MMVASPPHLLRSQAARAAQQDAARKAGICESSSWRGNSAHRTLLCIKVRAARQDISASEIKLRRPE
jgi:hypothetical protein